MDRMAVAEAALVKSKDYGGAGVGASENISENDATPPRKRPYQSNDMDKIHTPPSKEWRTGGKGLAGASSASVALYSKIMNEIKAECA